MNTRIRRIIVALALIVALVPLSGIASAATGGTINVYFHVIRRGSGVANAPVTLSLTLSAADVERIGGEPLLYTLTDSAPGGDVLTVQVSAANGTGKTMAAEVIASSLDAGVYSWYAVTVWPDGHTTTSPHALLTVR